MRSLIITATMFTAFFSAGCSRNDHEQIAEGYSRSDRAQIAAAVGAELSKWDPRLSALPADVRDAFERRHVTSYDTKTDSRITSDRSKFDASCSVEEGYSGILFLRARQIGKHWVVWYEFGGRGHSACMLVFTRNGDRGAEVADEVYLNALQQSPQKFAAAFREKN